MKTFFRSRTPIYNEQGKRIGWRSHTYRREQPKVNHQANKAQESREQHKFLTENGVPRRNDQGQKLGLRKRAEIFFF